MQVLVDIVLHVVVVTVLQQDFNHVFAAELEGALVFRLGRTSPDLLEALILEGIRLVPLAVPLELNILLLSVHHVEELLDAVECIDGQLREVVVFREHFQQQESLVLFRENCETLHRPLLRYLARE